MTLPETTCPLRWLSLLTFALAGCYATRELAPPADAASIPDAVQPDTRADAAIPNRGLGADCSLGGTATAYSATGWLVYGMAVREPADDRFQALIYMSPRHRIVIGAGFNWNFSFTAGEGQRLTVGEYDAAWSDPGGPSFYVQAASRTCGSPGGIGTFTIHELVIGGSVLSELQRLRVSFTFACEGDPSTVTTGCLRYVAP